MAFAAGIYLVNIALPTGFIPGEDQGILYGIIQTPPGSTLEYTNAKSHELQALAKELQAEISKLTEPTTDRSYGHFPLKLGSWLAP